MKKWLVGLICLALCAGCVPVACAAERPYGYGGRIEVTDLVPYDLADWLDVEQLKASVPTDGPAVTWAGGLPQVTDEGFDSVEFSFRDENYRSYSAQMTLSGGMWVVPEGAITGFELTETTYWNLNLEAGHRTFSYSYQGELTSDLTWWDYMDREDHDSGWFKEGRRISRYANKIRTSSYFTIRSPRTDFEVFGHYEDDGAMEEYTVQVLPLTPQLEATYDANDILQLFDYNDYRMNGTKAWWRIEQGWTVPYQETPCDPPAGYENWSAEKVLALCPPQHIRPQPVPKRPGDADNNASITVNDALAILEYLAGKHTDINLTNANVNGNDGVDVEDALRILQLVAGWDVTLE